MGRRYLVVNADDFGQSAGVNEGIIEAHRAGVVTSASLMVRWPGAASAAKLSRAHPSLGIGLHLDFGEWYWDGNEWRAHYEVASLDDATALEREVDTQVSDFLQIVGRPPTHIDSHQHVHLREPLRTIVSTRAERLGIPVRRLNGRVRYCGDFYAQDEAGRTLPERTTVESLIALIRDLPEGATEVGCHPAAREDLTTMYSAERVQELQTLCDPRVRHAIDACGVDLRSFATLCA